MVLEILDEVKEVVSGSRGFETTVVQQVTDIVEQAEQDAEDETAHWYYSVPFAGVRYYSY